MKSFGYGFGFVFGGKKIDSQALAHFNRVMADSGTIPAGLLGCDAWFKAVKGVYGVGDITSAISSGIHPHYLGYKAGAGSGATLGSAAQTCYNAIGATGDVVQTSAASQPLILPHTGTNYVWLPGVSGNDCSTNTLSPVGTTALDVKIYVPVNKNVAAAKTITAQDGGSGANRIFSIEWANVSTGTITFFFNSGFASSITSSIGVGSVSSFSGWIRVTYSTNGTTATITFYKSTDGTNWTQLDQQTAASTGLGTSNAKVWVGSNNGGNSYIGTIYRVLISNSINGAPVVDFNPASYSRATSGTTWTSTTGEVWTLNTPSTNNALKAAIVDTTYLMGNGTSIGMRAASLNMTQTGVASYSAIRKFVNTSGTQVINELSSNYIASSGFITYANGASNLESIGIRADVGVYESNYTSTSTSLKLITGIRDITQTNEASPYLINNVSQSLVSAAVANNTAAMNATGYNLLARNNAASLWANIMLACDIISKNADSTGTQTAMYNALKPFLVNAI